MCRASFCHPRRYRQKQVTAPKVRKGVLLSAGCKIIGNIEIGENAKVGAGSVVLENVPANATVAGVPAKIVGKVDSEAAPALTMN